MASEPFTAVLQAPPRRFRPYPKYKALGIEGLRGIPAHWQVRRLKTIARVQLSNVDKKSIEGDVPVRLCNYVDVYYNDHITSAIEFMSATATPEQRTRFSLRRGDVLITKDSESWTDIAVSAVVAEDLDDVVCGYHLAHIRPLEELDGRFLARAFSAVGPRDQFQVAANGITRFGLSSDAVKDGLFAVPPLPEQLAIAAFLDRETAKIDSLVAKKERMIELLREKRTALITQAVTKGLDRNVPMKYSGVEWLGEIPAHWGAVRVKSITADHKQGFYTEEAYVDDGVKLARITDIDDDGNVSFANMPFVQITKKAELEFGIREGDFLFARSGTIGRFGVVRQPERAVFASYLIRFRFEAMQLEFLRYVFGSRRFRESLISSLHGGANQNVHAENIKERWIAVPPLREQARIAKFLDGEATSLDALIRRVREAIDYLRELRIALISAAVTGKIDVREGAA